jgi:hypothetical protein
MIKIGRYSGYEVNVIFNDIQYMLMVEEGVRGINIPVYVTYKPNINSWEAYKENDGMPLTIKAVYQKVL